MPPNWDDNEELNILREYLKIPSISREGYDYGKYVFYNLTVSINTYILVPLPTSHLFKVPCIEFLKREAAKIALPVTVLYPGGPKNPILIMEWTGTEPGLPKILLNSHMDVVPVNEDEWSHPPFSADIDCKGRIYARGIQDMKNDGMSYLAAIRGLKRAKIRLKRTVLLVYVPDEENGGKFGMKLFVTTAEFKRLNIGFAMGAGSATENEEFDVFYGERSQWHLRLKVTGTPGHASLLTRGTVGEKVRKLVDKFMDYRACEIKRFERQYTKLNLGDINSVNLTMINGGTHNNVMPPVMTLSFDCRLALRTKHDEFEKQIYQWIEEAGGGIDIIYDDKSPYIKPTNLDKNIFWHAFQKAISELHLKTKLQISADSSDCRHLREFGIPSIGFSALNNTPLLAHCPDEFVTVDTYLKGIEIWKKIILHVGNA